MYDAICASGKVLCVCECMITCKYMFILAQEHCESGLWAACKSLRLGGRENHRLILQLFAQPFLCLDSLTAHKEMFTVHTHTCRLSGTQTNAHGELTDGESEFLFVAKCPVSEVPAPRCSLSSQRGPQWEVERNSTPAAGS